MQAQSIPSQTNSLRFRRLKIAYSWKCNARCSHCVVSSHPKRTEKLPPEVVLQCIDTAADWGMEDVEFTGGEILIFPHDLRTFMERACRRGLPVRLDTNSFWARKPEAARRLLGRLKQRGLVGITLSSDVYHLPYIDLQSVLNAVDAAQELEIDCRVTVCMVRDDLSALGLISQLRRHTSKIQTQYVAPFGRARQMDPERMVLCSFQMAGPPCSAVYAPLVAPDRRVTLCCAPPAQFPLQVARFSPLVLGWLTEERLETILRRAQNDPLLNRFAQEGLRGLLGKLNTLRPGSFHPRSEGYFGTCDLCQEIFTSRSRVGQIREVLADLIPMHGLEASGACGGAE